MIEKDEAFDRYTNFLKTFMYMNLTSHFLASKIHIYPIIELLLNHFVEIKKYNEVNVERE